MKNTNNTCKLYKGFADFDSLSDWILLGLKENKKRRYATMQEIEIYKSYIDNKKYSFVGIDSNYQKEEKSKSNNDIKSALKNLIEIIRKEEK